MPGHAVISEFELIVLLAVMRVGEDAYGVPVAREIEGRTGQTVAVAAVYAALQRLEGRGFVSSVLGDPTASRGGRAKRFFHVTSKGIKEAREAQRAFIAMWQGLPQLKGRTV